MTLLKNIILTSICLCILCACAPDTRMRGDVGGMPVTFHVLLERPFVSAMANRQARVGGSVQAGIGSNYHSSRGSIGLSFQSTRIMLYGGDSVGQANIFRTTLQWGMNTFTIPLRPQRQLTLTAVVSGAREGWEGAGTCTIDPKNPDISLTLGKNGAAFLDQKD